MTTRVVHNLGWSFKAERDIFNFAQSARPRRLLQTFQGISANLTLDPWITLSRCSFNKQTLDRWTKALLWLLQTWLLYRTCESLVIPLSALQLSIQYSTLSYLHGNCRQPTFNAIPKTEGLFNGITTMTRSEDHSNCDIKSYAPVVWRCLAALKARAMVVMHKRLMSDRRPNRRFEQLGLKLSLYLFSSGPSATIDFISRIW